MNIEIVKFSKNKYVLIGIEKDSIQSKTAFLIKISRKIPNLKIKEFVNLMINKFNALKFNESKMPFYFQSYENAEKAKEWIEQYLVMNKISK
ncbi:MAG: hypothetical protein ACOCP8_01425 [archaeon]